MVQESHSKPRNVRRPAVSEWPPRVLTRIKQIQAWWLTDRLRKNGHLSRGEVEEVNVTWRWKKARGCHLIRLVVRYSHGVVDLPRQFFLKSNRREHGRSRKAILEGVFYRDLAQDVCLPIPRCYDIGTDDEMGFCHLLMEDISQTHSTRPFAEWPEEQALSVGDCFAKIHAHWWGTQWWEQQNVRSDDFLSPQGGIVGLAHIPAVDAVRDHCQELANRYFPVDPSVAKRLHLPLEQREVCERAIRSWPRAILPRIAGEKNLTLLHGDADSSNVFYPQDPDAHDPLIFDWESCTRGLGVYDICRFILAPALPPEERRVFEEKLLKRYHNCLIPEGVQDYTWEDCLHDYRLSIIAHLQVPLEVTYDWLDGLPHQRALERIAANIVAFEDWECKELLL